MSDESPAHWSPPAEFDDFRVVRPLGRGGMGHVYLGHDEALDRPVALKFLAAERPDAGARERFLVEARAIARLQHPNVVSIFRIGEVAAKPYLAYEFIRGQTLEQIDKPLPWQRAVDVGIGLTRGLAAAHRRGVLHRDIKPANVVLSEHGDVKLLDFGLAKLLDSPELGPLPVEGRSSLMPPSAHEKTLPKGLTRTGSVLGTPLYCAPEIWRGGPAGLRSDVYALGLVLYQLFSGRLPWEATASFSELECRVLLPDRIPLAALVPELPSALAEVIDRCVAASAMDRPSSAEETQTALEAAHAYSRATRGISWDDDGWRVAESFARLTPRADTLVERFYQRLFTSAPELRRLFPADLSAQRQKLASALRLAVESLGQPDQLAPMLENLGRRHAAYGARPEHFAVLGGALLASLEELEGPAWSEPLAVAWQRAYGIISDSMRRGLLGGLRAA